MLSCITNLGMQAYSLWKGLDTDMDLGKLKTLFNRYLVNLAVLILRGAVC